jgi:hypothetical protein
LSRRLFFKVPEGVTKFFVEITIPPPGGAYFAYNPHRTFTIRRPDGSNAWKLAHHDDFYTGPNPVRVELNVKPSEAGQIWGITLPYSENIIFKMDPQILPYYSVSPEKWFNPEE